MDIELFKLITRRYIAWGFIAVATAVAAFIAVYGTITRQTELVTLACGALFVELGSVIAFYFGKRVSDE